MKVFGKYNYYPSYYWGILMSQMDKSNVNLDEDYLRLKGAVEQFIEKTRDADEETVYTASLFLNWLNKKTVLVSNEKSFSLPSGVDLRRSKVFWIDFGFNIGQEFGGRHPAIILRVSGELVFAVPLTSQEPDTTKDHSMFVEVPFIFDFPPLKRWVNVLNITSVSIQRIDFSDISGRVKGSVLDDIGLALKKWGIR